MVVNKAQLMYKTWAHSLNITITFSAQNNKSQLRPAEYFPLIKVLTVSFPPHVTQICLFKCLVVVVCSCYQASVSASHSNMDCPALSIDPSEASLADSLQFDDSCLVWSLQNTTTSQLHGPNKQTTTTAYQTLTLYTAARLLNITGFLNCYHFV